jgi:hypothetical protein
MMAATTDLLEDLAVPYVLVMSSVEADGGNWLRRAEYPELPGCVAESTNALEALREVDVLRIRMILEMRQRGERPPRPRPPLTSGLATIGVDDVDAFLAEIFHESRP